MGSGHCTSSLADGADRLNEASPELVNGAGELSKGAGSIYMGAEQLRDGSRQLSEGLSQAQTGADTLASGLKEGADKIRKIHTGDQAAEMFAAPVYTKESHDVGGTVGRLHCLQPDVPLKQLQREAPFRKSMVAQQGHGSLYRSDSAGPDNVGGTLYI